MARESPHAVSQPELGAYEDPLMAPHYREYQHFFTLYGASASPRWRPPQIGALGALLAHWAVHHRKPALIAMPTGSGKSAVATAAPYLVNATRVLVVVPSTQLRSQISESFSSEDDLRDIGALDGPNHPKVKSVAGMVADWEELRQYDVIVGLPDSISPAHYDTPPPEDLFDLIIIDEAHHSPAPTWRAILKHFDRARKVLLTATPRRRDGKAVPGQLVFHYPLRRAVEEGFYKSIEARVLPVVDPSSKDNCDRAIRDEVLAEFGRTEHSSSCLLVRAINRQRANDLVELYGEADLSLTKLTSDLGDQRKAEIIDDLRSGAIRAVVVVGMLGEGFNLPRLRVVAYHDKHKSLAATVQLIGRLARAHIDYPQPSVLVAARDAEVYPALKGALWELYQEDADWATLLPGIIDNEAQQSILNREYSEQLAPAPTQLTLEAIKPIVRATVFEVPDHLWTPVFGNGEVPEALRRGVPLPASQVLYSTLTPSGRTLLIVTQGTLSPRWHTEAGLDSPKYGLQLVTFIGPKLKGQSGLVLLNCDDGVVGRAVLEAIGAHQDQLRAADPERLQGAFDALDRISVSNVGVRNTYAGGRGQASYKMFAGSGVDRGMREADTAQAAIGHAMAQVNDGPGSSAYTTGFAIGRSRIWESRYVELRAYEEVMVDFAERYWSSERSTNPLLPSVTRGYRLQGYPESPVAAIELNPTLLGSGWQIESGTQVDRLDLRIRAGASSADSLPLEAFDLEHLTTAWSGELRSNDVHDGDSGPLLVKRGHGPTRSFAELLAIYPPTVYFANGTTVVGQVAYLPRDVGRDISRITPQILDWTGYNIQKETDRSAESAGAGKSVHQAVRDLLAARPLTTRYRWILENDGSGELADILLLELTAGLDIRLELWHVKPSIGVSPSVRVGDMQVVVAQAIKSRRWLTDLGLWREMGDRLVGTKSPRLIVTEGSERLLRALLGVVKGHKSWSLEFRPHLLRGKVVIAQPGLAWERFTAGLADQDQSATQIRDLLAVFDDSLGALGTSELVCSR